MQGPFIEETDDGAVYRKQVWYRQPADKRSHPLPYSLDTYFNTFPFNSNNYKSWSYTADAGVEMDAAVLRAREDFIDKMRAINGGPGSSVGANIATWRMSFNMLAQRAIQLRNVVQTLRSGNIIGAAKLLRVRPPTVKSRLKGYSNVWLEMSYGWKPLLQDIYGAVETLQQPMLHGSGEVVTGSGVVRSDFTWSSGPYYYATWQRISRVCKAKVQATVEIKNPNLWLANKLGLINPATVVWEVIPFSFVVDWFVPVGRFLESFTDFVGVETRDAFNTKYGVIDHELWRNDKPASEHMGKRRIQVTRSLGIPPYVLRPRFTGFASARGANAIALLISSLKRLQ